MQDVAPDRTRGINAGLTADVEPGRKRGGEEGLTTDVEQDLEPGHRATDGQGVEPIIGRLLTPAAEQGLIVGAIVADLQICPSCRTACPNVLPMSIH